MPLFIGGKQEKENNMALSIYDLSWQPQGAGTMSTPKQSGIYDRLLSPQEYDELPKGSKVEFNNYMDYVSRFQQEQKKKNKYGTTGTTRVPQGGTYYTTGMPENLQTIGARLGGGKTLGGSAIPEYRVRKDLRGRLSYEPVGSGVMRTMEGEVIPRSIEATQSQAQLDTIIPTIEAETAGQLATKQAKALTANAAIEDLQSGMTARRQAQQRIEQGQQRIGIAQEGLDLRNKQYETRLSDKEYIEAVKQENRQANIKLYETLRNARDEWKSDYDMERLRSLGQIPGTEEAKKKALQELDLYRSKAQVNLENAQTMEEKKFQNKMLSDLQTQIFWYEKELSKTLPLGTRRNTTALEQGKTQVENQKEKTQSQPPFPGAFWSEKRQRWWIKNQDGSIKWL